MLNITICLKYKQLRYFFRGMIIELSIGKFHGLNVE